MSGRKARWLVPLSGLLALFLFTCVDPNHGTVARVVDGDTIVLADGRRVRYIGIDAPELETEGRPAECYAQEATEANRRLVAGKSVRLERDVSETDRFGRLLRYVYVNDTMADARLVEEGFAEARAYPPDAKYQADLERLEREAQAARRGLWGACQR